MLGLEVCARCHTPQPLSGHGNPCKIHTAHALNIGFEVRLQLSGLLIMASSTAPAEVHFRSQTFRTLPKDNWQNYIIHGALNSFVLSDPQEYVFWTRNRFPCRTRAAVYGCHLFTVFTAGRLTHLASSILECYSVWMRKQAQNRSVSCQSSGCWSQESNMCGGRAPRPTVLWFFNTAESIQCLHAAKAPRTGYTHYCIHHELVGSCS